MMPATSPEASFPLVDIDEPATRTTVSFNKVKSNGELILSVHVDTIQAMLLTAGSFPELDVMIKGRVGEDEEDRITADPLFKIFTQKRVERYKSLREAQVVSPDAESRSRLTVEKSAGEPFGCKFFRMNELVEGLIAGEVNATHLMVNFGGATDLEIGSDVASHEQLEAYAGDLVFQVHARQLGEVPDSILRNRLQ